jgi:FXSXX-COOH protein
VDSVTAVGPSDEVSPSTVLDVREVPLERLATDADVRRMVTGVLQRMEEPRVRVTGFSSAI